MYFEITTDKEVYHRDHVGIFKHYLDGENLRIEYRAVNPLANDAKKNFALPAKVVVVYDNGSRMSYDYSPSLVQEEKMARSIAEGTVGARMKYCDTASD